ncbi:uracil-DNA glycosylase family protein [Teichococcus vastitatis]|uniref:Uracil-DNA glycosylase family protein n=1 Tax=Teichococcus vastitatis TaxID=2307076 RepID=A0ABS9W4W9_9PROT|nr:uracil-DNA glycosylase family protein [Pseudoroseomonas vastitatis]MCI0753955.1 uracil-DNA glycosylase family protein [Pseudoroseomonas vastitatis]
MNLENIAAAARACTLCAAHLPLGPKPIFRISRTARLLILSQAPGTRAHESGIPWEDASGDRLRDWLGLDKTRFHDAARIAILPTGLCYPGRLARGGDAPPRPECALLWHPRLLAPMTALKLTLLVGRHAIAGRLGPRAAASLERTVQDFAQPLRQGLFPLPHPSWRTKVWAAKRPWFETEVLPALRRAVAAALAAEPPVSR